MTCSNSSRWRDSSGNDCAHQCHDSLHGTSRFGTPMRKARLIKTRMTCSRLLAPAPRDLPIQERKAKLKDFFGGYLGSAGKTPDLLCLEESFPERLHT